MKIITKYENHESKLLMGITGVSLFLVSAYIDPFLLKNFFADQSIPKIGVVLGASIFTFMGFLGFGGASSYSLIYIKLNIYRVIYVLGFLVMSHCSSTEWTCFQ